MGERINCLACVSLAILAPPLSVVFLTISKRPLIVLVASLDFYRSGRPQQGGRMGELLDYYQEIWIHYFSIYFFAIRNYERNTRSSPGPRCSSVTVPPTLPIWPPTALSEEEQGATV